VLLPPWPIGRRQRSILRRVKSEFRRSRPFNLRGLDGSRFLDELRMDFNECGLIETAFRRPNDEEIIFLAAVRADGVETENRSCPFAPSSDRTGDLAVLRSPEINRDFSTTNRWIPSNAVSLRPHLHKLSIHVPFSLLPSRWTAWGTKNRRRFGRTERADSEGFGSRNSELYVGISRPISIGFRRGRSQNVRPVEIFRSLKFVSCCRPRGRRGDRK